MSKARAKRNIIDPPKEYPLRKDLRYSFSMRVLGELERLAKARFEIRQLTELDLSKWEIDGEPHWAIAQSVNASSEIEGEHIRAEELPLAMGADQSASNGHFESDHARKIEAIRSIYRASLWALSRDTRSYITFDFVLELHRRMFESTKPREAGRIKNEPINIRGAGYHIETLAPHRAQLFLEALCKRTNDRLTAAHDFAEASMLLTVAEFVVDFLAIHPFKDGNGRTARLLSTYLLERSGYHFARFYPVDSIILETRPAYYEALFQAQRNWYYAEEDLSPWIEYYIHCVFTQWTRAYQLVRDEANRSPPL